MSDNNNTRTVTVQVAIGEEVSISKQSKTSPNFFRVGNGTMNKDKIESIDLLRELANSSKPAQFLLLAIKDGITWDNNYEPVVKVTGKTSTEVQYIKAGYKELLERNLVRRIKRSYYMINPNALIPREYDKAKKIWDEAGKNKTPTP